MKATNSLKAKSVLAVFLMATQLVIVSADVLAAQALDTATALPDGIYQSDTMTQEDAAYLAANLEYLRAQLPQWWQYVMDTRPFTLSFDDTLAEDGRAAITECCDAQGNGLVKFGYHLGELTNSDDTGSETVEARQATFLGLLIHELTHVRDLRAERFPAKTNRKSCIAAERSGLSKQLEVKQDLADKLASDPTADPAFRAWLDRQIKTEATDLHSRKFWDFYCGGFDE